MPDHSMPPYPFREALDALVDATYCSALADERGGQDEKVAWQERYAAARAEVERLYAARVGEEGWLVRHPHESMCQFWTKDPTGYVVPDSEVVRVFVTKGEAG